MPEIKIISEDAHDDYLSIVLEGDDFLHFVIVNASEMPDSGACLYNSANKIKIHVRNSSYDNFRYEAMAHHLLNLAGIAHKHFSIQAFDNVNDFSIFEPFIFLLNKYFGSNFTTEQEKGLFLIKRNSEVILQTFL